jgi:hypothetical protein
MRYNRPVSFQAKNIEQKYSTQNMNAATDPATTNEGIKRQRKWREPFYSKPPHLNTATHRHVQMRDKGANGICNNQD